MEQNFRDKFTKYEVARIIGARALQIAMDAPILLKLSEEDLKSLDYDALRIAERELEDNVLPIAVHRPSPQKVQGKLAPIKEETVSDEELIEKEQEVIKEIQEDATESGLVNESEVEEDSDTTDSSSTEE
jgi:DNA-directed RNA polymerase subunit K